MTPSRRTLEARTASPNAIFIRLVSPAKATTVRQRSFSASASPSAAISMSIIIILLLLLPASANGAVLPLLANTTSLPCSIELLNAKTPIGASATPSALPIPFSSANVGSVPVFRTDGSVLSDGFDTEFEFDDSLISAAAAAFNRASFAECRRRSRLQRIFPSFVMTCKIFIKYSQERKQAIHA